ncbi:hypothetical protein SAMN05444157_3343 [Frankineae bacterium MT45]|nr:hypothetical protein SAMN05444157_3343 [Frankineae bacterium MT45]
MSLLDDIEGALDFGGMSLSHIKSVASSVKTGPMLDMARAFDHGHSALVSQHEGLVSAATKVVGGWKGQAADAASTSVLKTATTSRESSYAAQSSSQNIRHLVATIHTEQAKIDAVEPVDTSFSAAVHNAGGPVAAVFHPGAVVANMAAAQLKANQHKATAAGYLNTMNNAGNETASAQAKAFDAIPLPNYGFVDPAGLPLKMTVPAVSSGGSGPGSGPIYSPTGPDGSYAPPSTGSPSPGGPPVSTVTPVHSGPTVPDPGNPGSTAPAGSSPTPTVPTAPPGSTLPSGANPSPAGGPPPGTVTATPGLPTSVGVGAGALAGGGALLAAGGLSGFGPGGAFSGGGTASGTSGGSESAGAAGRSGALAGEGEDGSVARLRAGGPGASGGRGFSAGDPAETSGLRGGGIRGGFGDGSASSGEYGSGVAEAGQSPLRAGSLGSAAGSELAAGETRGIFPGGGAGGRRSDEEELNKRPDYLVETDDIWGDGRLAAPPVLG